MDQISTIWRHDNKLTWQHDILGICYWQLWQTDKLNAWLYVDRLCDTQYWKYMIVYIMYLHVSDLAKVVFMHKRLLKITQTLQGPIFRETLTLWQQLLLLYATTGTALHCWTDKRTKEEARPGNLWFWFSGPKLIGFGYIKFWFVGYNPGLIGYRFRGFCFI